MAGPDGPSPAPNSRKRTLAASQIDLIVQRRIGNALRDYCEHIIREPVPEKFNELLRRLEREENERRRPT